LSERLLIAPPLIEAMLQAARDALPEECCGLLVGSSDGRVTRLVPAANVHETPRRFFTIDPAVQFATLRELRAAGGGEEVIGHYHSHPEGPAEPSLRDLVEAVDPQALWIVIDPSRSDLAAFRPRPGEAFVRMRIEST
jgi:proteasome lid subunit RPN8/RPN11